MTDEKRDRLKILLEEKQRIEDEIKNIEISDPQESMEGVLSSIVQKVKNSSNPSINESKEEATKRNDDNT